jgi:hypothetical protein
MTNDDPLPSAPVAAAFARWADAKHATSQEQASSAKGRLIRAVCNSLLALTLVMAIALSIYASLP